MIKIFNANDRDFSTAGNIIIEPIKCIEYKKKSLNGWYIEVEIPIKYKEYISKDKLCVVKTKSKLNPQAFRIGEDIEYSTRKIKFQANHVMFDSKDYVLLDVRPTNQNGLNALNYINDRTDNLSPFSIYSNVENVDTAYFIRKNLLEAWTTIEERWGGVFDADNWNISFLTSVGNDNGETIAYGKNMQGFDIYEDWSSVCTKLLPVGYDGLLLPETYLESDVQYEKPYTRVVDFQTNLETEEQTEESLLSELRQNAEAYLEENKVPKVSYTIVSNVNQTLEIGDTIKVLHPFVNLFTEVLEYEYDIILGKVKSLTFGNYNRDVKTKFDNIKNSITQINQALSKQEIAIKTQTNLINTLNKNGYVYIDDNEILILDTLPKEKAKNVWRFGLGGIGFSSNGYEGPFETAITMDGKINADFITTGTMAVSRIEGLSNFMTDTEKQISEIELEQGNIKLKVEEVQSITKTKEIKEGNPIKIDDSSEEPILELEFDGKSTQATRDGKNKFDASKITNTTISVLDNGKTIKMPITTSGNGYTLVGTNLKGICPKLEVGDTVYLLGDTTSQKNKVIYLGGNSKFTWGFGKSRTLTENDLNAAFVLYGNNFEKGETEQVTISNLRIVKNASDEWEEYGISPSPEYPSEIKSIGDDINLINDADIINGSLSSGNIVSGYGYRLVTNNPIPVKSSTDYNINFRNIVEFKGVRVGIHSYDAEGNFISDSGWVGFTDLQATIKTGANCKLVRFVFSFSKTSTSVTTGGTEYTGNITPDEFKTFKIKFQEGSKATGYSKYGEGTLNIEQRGKNLFDKSKSYDYTNVPNKITSTQIDTGVRIQSSYDGGGPYVLYILADLTNYVGKIIRTKSKIINSSKNKGRYILALTNSDYSVRITKAYTDISEKEISFVVPSIEEMGNNHYLGIYLYTNSTGTMVANDYVDYIDLIVTIDNEDMSYEPYFNNTYTLPLSEPLRSLPNGVKDTLEADGIHRRVGRKVFDETDNFSLGQTLNNVFMFSSDKLGNGKLNIGSNDVSISNFFKILYDYNADEEHFYYTNASKIYFFIDKSRLNTQNVNGFKTWLSTHNTEVIYELATETIEPYTDEQKEIINNIKTNLYTQYFSSDSNMKITYVRNNGLSDMYEIKNEANKKYTETNKKIGELITNANLVRARVQNIEDTYSTKTETEGKIEVSAEKINNELSKKVNGTDYTAAQILLMLNNDESLVKLKGDKVDISGKAVSFSTEFSKTFGPFTNEDRTKIINYLKGTIELTEIEKEKYDLNADGIISSADLLLITRAINAGGYLVQKGTFQIDPYSSQRSIILKDENGNVITSLGYLGIKTESLVSDSILSKGEIKAKNILIEDDGSDIDESSYENIIQGNVSFTKRVSAKKLLVNENQVYGQSILYDNASGTSGTVSAAGTWQQFAIEIIYKNDDGQYGSTGMIYNPVGKTVYGAIIRKSFSDDSIMFNSALFTINENAITISRNSQANIHFGGNSNTDTNKLYITQVIGYYGG